MIILLRRVYGSCFLVINEIAVIFVYHQNGEYFANLWCSVRRAVESAHKFCLIRFYIDASTFELS